MLAVCGKTIPIEVCDKIHKYAFDIQCLENKRAEGLLYDIKKISMFMNEYNAGKLFGGNFGHRRIYFLAHYINVCRVLHFERYSRM